MTAAIFTPVTASAFAAVMVVVVVVVVFVDASAAPAAAGTPIAPTSASHTRASASRGGAMSAPSCNSARSLSGRPGSAMRRTGSIVVLIRSSLVSPRAVRVRPPARPRPR
jgi:hypothetical protein